MTLIQAIDPSSLIVPRSNPLILSMPVVMNA